MLINEKTRSFISEHANDDVRRLALQGSRDSDIDLTTALQQIAGRQTARRKLPTWAVNERIIYPPHLNMEQCSSEQTAKYKSNIAGKGERIVDLTGGFGVDFYWMSQGFNRRVYVEQNEELCSISTENFRMLNHDCSVCCCDTTDYLKQMEYADVINLDPARRNEHGGRTYSIGDCTPNVIELLPLLREKADRIIIKLSPMLDWRKAVADLAGVSEVHIISVNNECKELVLVVNKNNDSFRLICVNDDNIFEVSPSISHQPLTPVNDLQYLYEPNASIMKAGCFEAIKNKFAVQQIADNSHLFISTDEISDFPGRRFHISAVSSMNKRELRDTLRNIECANITVRNFPLTADQLRKKLKVRDGGEIYIFATTEANGAHCLYICRKIG